MKFRYRIGVRIINLVWKVLFGFHVEGRKNIPKNGGMIIASNHLSNFDPHLVGTAVWFRECYFFAKSELFINKFFAWLIRAFNAIEVDTKSPKKETLRYTQELLNKGLGVIFFPEGTRSLEGKLLNFNPGVGWLALRTGASLVPVAIKGTNTSLASQFLRKNRVYVKFGPPLNTSEFEMSKEGRTIVTQAIERKIKELYASISNS